MTRTLQLLICDDDRNFHLAMKQTLKSKYNCKSAHDTDEAFAILKSNPIDIVLLDVEMRRSNEGLQAIPKFRNVDPDLSIVMSSGRTDFPTVREALLLGVNDYVAKDADPEEIFHVLDRVAEQRRLRQQSEQKDFEVKTQQKQHVLIGESSKIQSLKKIIAKVRMSPANVMIHGETGAGKEVVARQLRKLLPDGTLAPFIAIDSATIQSSMAESILFGYEKGAFTGAEKTTKGIFEEADGGVVYFDEIANMPLEIQAKLLRVIQEKELVRMGSSKVIHSDFRVVCASNRDLEAMVKTREFKDDLLQRLNVLPIELPPLRDRVEDIPLLVTHFLSRLGSSLVFSQDALDALKIYPWPGNVRELGNLLAYLTTMSEGSEIEVSDLPPKIRDIRLSHAAASSSSVMTDRDASFYERVARFESELLAAEYEKHDGNISRMALHLGMDRSHLYTKLKEHSIRKPSR